MLVFFDIGKVKRVLSASKTTTSKYLYIPDIYLYDYIGEPNSCNLFHRLLPAGTPIAVAIGQSALLVKHRIH